MSLDIFEIDNLFWNNNSYRVPNALPTNYKDAKQDVKVIPSIFGREGGEVRLVGGHWNYCKFQNEYYFLKKAEPLDRTNDDITKQVGNYHLIRDHWTNLVLKNPIKVIGDLITGKHEELLSENLNKCLITLEDPAEITRIPLNKTSYKGQDQLIKIFTNKTFTTPAIVKAHWEDFVARCRSQDIENIVNRYKAGRKILHQNKAEVFILGTLKTEIDEVRHGKEEVKEQIIEWIKEITGENTKIYKVTHEASTSTNIVNNYCISRITANKGHLGSEDTTQTILKIDLSGLTDIVKVRLDNLEKDKQQNKELDKSRFIVEDKFKPSETAPCGKVCRRIYMPGAFHNGNNLELDFKRDKATSPFTGLPAKLNKPSLLNPKVNYGLNATNYRESFGGYSDGLNRGLGRYPWYYTDGMSYSGGHKGFEGVEEYGQPIKQEVKFKSLKPEDYLNIEQGYLYGVDRVDFALSGRIFTISGTLAQFGGISPDLRNYPINRNIPPSIYASASTTTVVPIMTGGITFDNTYLFPRFRPHTPYDYSQEGTTKYVWDGFNKPPCFGFLLYQVVREGDDWDTLLFTGSKPLKQLKYYSGFNRQGGTKYGDQSDGTHGFGKLYDTQLSNYSTLNNTSGIGDSLSRFLLCLDGTLFRYFTPDFYEYQHRQDYYDAGGINEITTSISQPLTLVHQTSGADGGKGSKLIPTPYKDEETYRNFNRLTRQAKYIDPVVIKGDVKTPQGFVINKNDIFFSSLEYELRHFNSDLGNGAGTSGAPDGKGLENANYFIFKDLSFIGDQTQAGFVEKGDRSKVKDSDLIHKTHAGQPTIALTTHPKTGNLEIRTLEYFHDHLILDHSANNVVDTVDGSQSKDITFIKLAYTGINAEELNEEELFGLFMSLTGHEYDKKTNKIQWFDKEDLLTEEAKLFDLVGTPGFALFRGTDIHLILKKEHLGDATIITPIKEESNLSVYSLTGEEAGKLVSKLEGLTLLEKINQLNTINYRTIPRHLKSRFLFDGTDKLFVNLYGLEPDKFGSSTNNFLLVCKTDWDHIEETITISKRPEDIKPLIEQVTLDQFQLQLSRADEDRELQRQQYDEFAKRKIDTAFDRAVWDLNFDGNSQKVDRVIGSIGNVAQGLAGMAVGMATKTIAASTPRKGKEKPVSPELLKLRKTKIYGSAISQGFGMLERFANMGADWYFRSQEYTEDLRRVHEDKEIAYQDVFFRNLSFDMDHFRRKQDAILEMNRLQRTMLRGMVNDVALADKVEKLRKTGDTYLTIRTPSQEQLKYLEAFTEEYGVDCYIPDTAVTLQRGMEANVIRFKNIESDKIIGITDIVDRELIISRLHVGIKIVDVSKQAREREQYDQAHRKEVITSLTKNLERRIEEIQTELAEEQERILALNKELKQKEEQLAQEEQAKEKLTSDKATLEAEIAQIRKNLEESQTRHEDLKELYKTATENLAKEIKKVEEKEAEIAKKTNELQQNAQELTRKGDEISKLNKDKEILEDTLKKCNAEKETKQEELAKKEQEAELLRKQLETQKQEHEDHKQNKEGEIAKLNKQIEDKDKEIDTIKKQVRDKETEIGEIQKQLTQATNRAEALHQANEKCGQDLTTQTNLANLYRAEANKLKEELKKPKEISEKEREDIAKEELAKISKEKFPQFGNFEEFKSNYSTSNIPYDDNKPWEFRGAGFANEENRLGITISEHMGIGGTIEFLEEILIGLKSAIEKHAKGLKDFINVITLDTNNLNSNQLSKIKLICKRCALLRSFLFQIVLARRYPESIIAYFGQDYYPEGFTEIRYNLDRAEGTTFPRNYSGSSISFEHGKKYILDNNLIRLIICRAGERPQLLTLVQNSTKQAVQEIYEIIAKERSARVQGSEQGKYCQRIEITQEYENSAKHVDFSRFELNQNKRPTVYPGYLIISALAMVSGGGVGYSNLNNSKKLSGTLQKLETFIIEMMKAMDPCRFCPEEGQRTEEWNLDKYKQGITAAKYVPKLKVTQKQIVIPRGVKENDGNNENFLASQLSNYYTENNFLAAKALGYEFAEGSTYKRPIRIGKNKFPEPTTGFKDDFKNIHGDGQFYVFDGNPSISFYFGMHPWALLRAYIDEEKMKTANLEPNKQGKRTEALILRFIPEVFLSEEGKRRVKATMHD